MHITNIKLLKQLDDALSSPDFASAWQDIEDELHLNYVNGYKALVRQIALSKNQAWQEHIYSHLRMLDFLVHALLNDFCEAIFPDMIIHIADVFQWLAYS